MTHARRVLAGVWLSGLVIFAVATAVFAFAHFVPDRVVTETLGLKFQSDTGTRGRLLFKTGEEVSASEVLDYRLAKSTSQVEREVTVTIDPAGKSIDPRALGSQIWVASVRTDLATTPDWQQMRLPPGWRIVREEFTQRLMLLNEGQTREPVEFRMRTKDGNLAVQFYTTPYSGRASVAVDGVTLEDIDTYAERTAFRLVNLTMRPRFDDTSTVRVSVERQSATTLRFELSDRIGRFRLEELTLAGSRTYRWQPGTSIPRLGPGAKLVQSDRMGLEISVTDPSAAWIELSGLPRTDGIFGLQRRALLMGIAMLFVGVSLSLIAPIVLRRLHGRRGFALAVAPLVGTAALMVGMPWPEDDNEAVILRDESSRFELSSWADEFESPVGLAFADENVGFVIEKGGWSGLGTGRVFQVGGEERGRALVLELEVCADAERGLLGIALDPAFSENGHVYLYYTYPVAEACPIGPDSPITNRVSRFNFDGERIDPSSEAVLVDGIPAGSSAHNGGGLRFSSGGSLFIGTGEGMPGMNSQAIGSLGGKILRINPTPNAVIAPDNPFVGLGDKQALVWAYGFRNPFRFDVRPGDDLVLIGDVGSDPPDAFEEINLGRAGGNYGWPKGEGITGNDDLVDPLYVYEHDALCNTVIGGSFIGSDVYGDDLNGAFVFTDFSCGRVTALQLAGSQLMSATTLVSQNSDHEFVHIERNPGGSLYLVDIRGSVYELRRRADSAR